MAIPVDREKGPWNKYIAEQVEAGGQGGFRCKKCGNLFPNVGERNAHKATCSVWYEHQQ